MWAEVWWFWKDVIETPNEIPINISKNELKKLNNEIFNDSKLSKKEIVSLIDKAINNPESLSSKIAIQAALKYIANNNNNVYCDPWTIDWVIWDKTRNSVIAFWNWYHNHFDMSYNLDTYWDLITIKLISALKNILWTKEKITSSFDLKKVIYYKSPKTVDLNIKDWHKIVLYLNWKLIKYNWKPTIINSDSVSITNPSWTNKKVSFILTEKDGSKAWYKINYDSNEIILVEKEKKEDWIDSRYSEIINSNNLFTENKELYNYIVSNFDKIKWKLLKVINEKIKQRFSSIGVNILAWEDIKIKVDPNVNILYIFSEKWQYLAKIWFWEDNIAWTKEGIEM